MHSEFVTAPLKFIADLSGELVYVPSTGGGDTTSHVGNYCFRDVPIHDARQLPSTKLDVEGFELVAQSTAVSNFHDGAQIDSTWHREVKELLIETTGASRVEIFDDTLRTSSQGLQREHNIREPAEIVHNDYTARSGIKRLRDFFAEDPEEAERLLSGRFAIINVWRSTSGPVLNHPLAFCDATTLKAEHLVSVERRAEERIGELQAALYDDSQRWYYYPRLSPEEALLIKTFDSDESGATRFTPHTSFADPTAPETAPARESVETRCFVFY